MKDEVTGNEKIDENRELNLTQSHFITLSNQDELNFFFKEYKYLETEKLDYYYLIPFSWFEKWDIFVSNPRYL